MGPISGACLIPTNPFSRNSSTFTPPGARNEPAPASAARENAPSNHELFEVSEYSLIELGIRVKWTPHAEERAIESTNPTVSSAVAKHPWTWRGPRVLKPIASPPTASGRAFKESTRCSTVRSADAAGTVFVRVKVTHNIVYNHNPLSQPPASPWTSV